LGPTVHALPHHESGILARRDAVALPAQIAKEDVVLFVHVLLVIGLVLVLVPFASGRRLV